MVERSDLIVPVYLNQRIVFDMVAMLQGGIASVTTISQLSGLSSELSGEVSSKFGLSSALASLLRVDLSASAKGATSSEATEMRSEQRIHTPASLFMALRSEMRDKGLIVHDGPDAQFVPGDLVEFSASLRRNPLIETLGSFVELMDMFQALSDQPNKGKSRKPDDTAKMKKQIQSFIEALSSSYTVDLLAGVLESGDRPVVTLEQQYLNDPTMSDVVDGTFRVVGKVIRVVAVGEGAISLNRKSAMGVLPPSMLEEFKGSLSGPEFDAFGLPELEWEVSGPAIQVLPIAVFA